MAEKLKVAYNIYSGVVSTVVAIGTAVLGVYGLTGRAQAARAGRNFLGKGYNKQGAGRWVSKDGMRQMRLDKTGHIFKGQKLENHFNFDSFKTKYWITGHAKIKSTIHQMYKLFKTWFF